MKSLPVLFCALVLPTVTLAQARPPVQCTQPNKIHRMLCQLTDFKAEVRKAASAGLSKLGPRAVPDLVAALENDRRTIRWAAASVLGRIGKPALNAALSSLKHPDSRVREQAVRCLGIMAANGSVGGRRHAVIRALKVAARDPNDTVSKRATHALGSFGPKGLSAIGSLLKNLRHKDYHVRFAAADSLGHLGPKAAAAIPSLIVAMKDRHWPVKRSAALALGKMGPLAARAVPTLVRHLKNQSDVLPPQAYTHEKVKEFVRRHIVEALGAIGPKAAAAIPTLAKVALHDPSVEVRRAAAKSLEALGPEGRRALRGRTDLSLKQVFNKARRAEKAGKNSQAKVQYRQIVGRYLSNPSSDNDTSTAAHAAYRLGEIELQRMRALRMRGGMSDLSDNIVRWHSQFNVTKAAFEDVRKIGNKKWSVAARCRLGATNYRLVSLYLSVPPTEKMKQLGDEGIAAFRRALLDKGVIYLEAAQKHYGHCLRSAESTPFPRTLGAEARVHLLAIRSLLAKK